MELEKLISELYNMIIIRDGVKVPVTSLILVDGTNEYEIIKGGK